MLHDLIAGAIALASLAVAVEAARVRSSAVPRMYGGGVDLADRPATDQWRQP